MAESTPEGCPVDHSKMSEMYSELVAARSMGAVSLGSETAQPFGPGDKKYDHAITYWDYIHPEKLTSLQTGREGKGLNHHDEHLFIIVHQVFELWFKQVLFEMESVLKTLQSDSAPDTDIHLAQRHLARAEKILRQCVMGFDIIETMDPVDFLEYRDWLTPASGFQSVQMRQIEIIMGLQEAQRVQCNMSDYREAFVTPLADKTPYFDTTERGGCLKDAVFRWLGRVDIPQAERFLEQFLLVKSEQLDQQIKELRDNLSTLEKITAATDAETKMLNQMRRHEKKRIEERIADSKHRVADIRAYFGDADLGKARLNALFLLTFRHHPRYLIAADLVGGLMELEQAFLLWRHRHARMVERMIGRRTGTGGSSGMDYLDATAAYRVFVDLWNIRSMALPPSKFPDVAAEL